MMSHSFKPILKPINECGLALPTVLALFMVSSVMLLAGWRNITLAQGWSRHQTERWQLKQAALNALTTTADAIASSSHQTSASLASSSSASPAFPVTLSDWALLQTQLPVNGCMEGICRPLLTLGQRRSEWLNLSPQAKSAVLESGQRILSWVEVLPCNMASNHSAPLFMYRITVIALNEERHNQVGWQAVWRPVSLPLDGQAVRLADMQRMLELLP